MSAELTTALIGLVLAVTGLVKLGVVVDNLTDIVKGLKNEKA